MEGVEYTNGSASTKLGLELVEGERLDQRGQQSPVFGLDGQVVVHFPVDTDPGSLEEPGIDYLALQRAKRIDLGQHFVGGPPVELGTGQEAILEVKAAAAISGDVEGPRLLGDLHDLEQVVNAPVTQLA